MKKNFFAVLISTLGRLDRTNKKKCSLLAARMRKLITARARKNKRTARKCSQRPFDTPYSPSSRENATPSSGTSPLASYKVVPPPPVHELISK